MNNLSSFIKGDKAKDLDWKSLEVSTLHSIISGLRNNLEAEILSNKEFKKSIDMLSAELGKTKRKLKRKENK